MKFEGQKYDQSICCTVKCSHGRDVHAANPHNASEPRHCTTPGCRCGAFRPTPIQRSAPQPAKPEVITELSARRAPNTKPDRKVRAHSLGRVAFGRTA